ncbi:MAG: hypothetical protein AAFV62_01910 [Pseudomonadota bacterium]
MRFYDPFEALFSASTQKRGSDALLLGEMPPPMPGEPQSWDFSEDPMLWARARYGERTPKEKLFADAVPFQNPLARLARALTPSRSLI